jgi:dienelactone hydrolase
MRLMELLAYLTNIGLVLWIVFKPDWPTKRYMVVSLAFSTLLTLLQPLVEGYRWQMVATYLLTLFLWAIAVKGRAKAQTVKERKYQRTGWKKALLAGLAVIYALIAGMLPVFLPVFSFESLTGSYAVGTVTYHWMDPKRGEAYTDKPDDHRELMVQVWYPSPEGEKGKKNSYIPYLPQFSQQISKLYGIPAFLLSYLHLVKTHSTEQSKLSDAVPKYPIVLFSPGIGGTRFQNTFQVEELASHGYIVVGMEHSYHSVATVFPDGHATGFRKMNLLDLPVSDKLTSEIYVKDIQFVLDQIESLNRVDATGRFKGRFDLNRIGIMGHSIGGAAAAQMLLLDPRVKAGINMDGTFFGEPIPGSGFKKPFMLLNSEPSAATETEIQPPQEILDKYGFTLEEFNNITKDIVTRKQNSLAGGGYQLSIQHTQHFSFSDFYMYSPLLQWMDGTNPKHEHQIINAYTVAFFDQFLLNKPSSLFNGISQPYREALLLP